jgi:hypothetical protein
VADIKSESRPASDRNRWPASFWNAWPASSESATEQLNSEFGGDNIHYDKYFQSTNSAVFPVLMPDERIEISTQVSEVIRNIPLTKVTYIFASPGLAENVTRWIAKNRIAVLKGGQK